MNEKIDSDNMMIPDTNDTNDTFDTKNSIKSIESINNIQYHGNTHLDFFKAKGHKEAICYYLFNKDKSFAELDKELGLASGTSKLVISRSQKSDNPLFEEVKKEGLVKYWTLSPQGKIFIETEISARDREEEKLKNFMSSKSEEERKGDIVSKFYEVLRDLDQIRNIEIQNIPIISLDFGELSELYPDISDLFLDDYANWKEELLKWVFGEYQKEAILRPVNLPVTCNVDIESLSAKNIDKLVKTKATIEYRSDVKEGLITKSKFECPSCGTIITIIQDSDTYKEPVRCSCGRRGGFKLIAEDITDFLEIIIRNKDITKTRTRLYLEIQGNDQIQYFNENLGNGKPIEIVGVYKHRAKFSKNKKTTRVIGYIVAESIKATNEDLSHLNITDADMIKIKEVGEDFSKESFNSIRDIVFPSTINVHKGQQVLSDVLLLQQVVGRNVILEDGTKKVEVITSFCYGDPAVKKSQRIYDLKQRIDPSVQSVNGSTTSSAGLLLGMDTFENKRFVSGGLLAQANNSIVCIDEIQKFDKEAKGSLHDVLASQTLKYNKVGFQIDENIDISMCFLGNPAKDRFNEKPIYSQIQTEENDYGKIESNFAFLSRCDFVIGIRDNATKEQNKLISLAIQRRVENSDSGKYTIDLIKKYLHYVKNEINPEKIEESELLISDLVSDLREIKGYYISNRLTETYQKASKCFAKLRLSDKVEKIDVMRTHQLYLDSLESLEVSLPTQIKNPEPQQKITKENPSDKSASKLTPEEIEEAYR